MPSLLEKIAASAAERLALPPGRSPADELARFKRFIKVESHRLKILHRAGAGGLQICRARAGMMDLLLGAIFEQVRRNLPAGGATRPVAVIALGGYGRGELNPRSDIDLMLLHDGDTLAATRGKGDPFLRALTEPGGLLYTLFDLDLKVGYSVRNIEDCVRAANADMQSKTSLIEARLVVGDTELFKRMQRVVLARCVRGHEEAYITARLQDQQERRAKFGNSACMQEPNIKNGCGGLRDAQNLIWMAFFKYRIRSLVELEQREQLTSAERRQIEAAYDFLLRVRNELHYTADRPVDQLSRSLQPAVAHQLGYTDRSPARRISAFMRDLYTHLRHVHLITRDLEQRLALVAPPRRLPRFRDLLPGRRAAAQQFVDGFRIAGGELHPGSSRVFRDQPRRLMRAFLLAQQRGLRLHPDLTQLMRNQLDLFKRAMLHDPHVQETFLEILGQRGNVARLLRAMHEVGLLGKFLPEFGHLTCLVQHEFYHQYAADEHTLVCLEKLDELWESEKPELKPYADLFRTVERPFVLYLALLLHDTGKALRAGTHTEAGARLATQVARRFRLDGATAHQLSLLIEHHLLLVQVSQRRDLEDRAVIRSVAAAVQSRENLDLLTLHTLADSRGTADNLWNGFKDSLLWTLHRKTTHFLAGGTEFIRAEARQRELLVQEVTRLLPPTFSPEEIQAHFAHLPPRYFQIHSAREIAADLTRVHRFMHFQVAMEDRALEPVVTWHNEPDRGYASVNVCTWDRAGLFSKISGSLTAAGLNILSAQIFSRTDGIILDTFFVADARTGLLPGREERERFEKIFVACLTGEVDLAGLIARRRTGRPLYQGYELEPLPTRIAFDNETSEGYTIIDLETEDRVGLLYAVSQAFAALGVDIALAKISTEKGAAVDSFYVSELDGAKILAPERQATIEAHLRAALAALDR
jgi:[protein-PII] uridylyltransferase